MFPSFNCNIDHNSFDESLLKKSPILSDLQNPSSKLDDPPFLFNFPSPFLDEHESPLNQIFFQNYLMASSDQIHSNSSADPTKKTVQKEGDHGEINPNCVIAPLRRSSRNLGVVPRRRTGKKDRHSKICTAQGIRDRRMRLSLQVARKFFDLQDMLGYDKASKTIEWLFTKSKKAIKELVNDHPQGGNNNISISDAKSESFLSECEVVSGVLIEDPSNKDVTMPMLCIEPCENGEKKKSSREKARERARCRTREKMVKQFEGSSQWYKPNPNGVDQESISNNLEKSSPYEDPDHYSSFQHHLADVGTIEKFLGNSSSSSSPSWPISENCSAAVSGYIDPSSNFMGFFGNWDLLNSDKVSSIYSVTNQVSLAGNPNSVYSGEFQ